MSEQNQQKTQEVTLREEKNNAITSLQDLVRTLDAQLGQCARKKLKIKAPPNPNTNPGGFGKFSNMVDL